MRIEKTNIYSLLKNTAYFKVPKYQRKYQWDTDNCERLLEDIKLIKNIPNVDKQKQHFFGSVVLSQDEDDADVFMIVDGQQRIITIIILLLAMIHACKKDYSIDLEDKDMILNSLSELVFYNDSCKINLFKDDAEVLQKISMEQLEELNRQHKLFENYRYMDNMLYTSFHYDYNRILDALTKLEIIKIELEETDNPQDIFDSLNSTGSKLSEVDKIRNYLLMKMRSISFQEDCYNEYWLPLEQRFQNEQDLGLFFKDYLMIKDVNMSSKKDNIYIKFKYTIGENFDHNRALEILEDIANFSEIYRKILKKNTGIKDVDIILCRAGSLINHAYPFFMEILNEYYNSLFTQEDVIKMFKIVESYCFRIYAVYNSSVNKVIFATLNSDIRDLPGDDYIEKMKYILLQKTGKDKFPGDKFFEDSLAKMDVYNSSNCNYIMGMYESFYRKTHFDIQTYIKCKECTIEHILPVDWQHEAWVKSLKGTMNTQKIAEKWTNKLANLTLLSFSNNSTLKNKSFIEKKKYYEESEFAINRYSVLPFDKWDEASLDERQRKMLLDAFKIWENINTSYDAPISGDIEYVYLSAASTKIEMVKMRTIEWFQIKPGGRKIKLWSDDEKKWSGFYVEAVRELANLDSTVLHKIIENKDCEGILFKKCLKGYKPVAKDIFVSKPTSANSVIKNLRILIKHYSLKPDEFKIKLSDEGISKIKRR